MPTCSSCGGNFDNAFQYCPYCGKLNQQEPTKVDVVSHDLGSLLACPRCNRVDCVAKVSAIVQSGTQHISGSVPVSYTSHDSEGFHSSTAYEKYSAIQRSDLVGKLMPPELPKEELPVMEFLLSTPVIVVFLTVITFLITLFIPDSGEISLLANILVFVLAAIGIAALVGYYVFMQYMSKLKKKKHAQEIVLWKQCVARWDKLYYCSRDGCVFFPGTDTAQEIHNLHDVIGWRMVA